jgi:hypothetical protein
MDTSWNCWFAIWRHPCAHWKPDKLWTAWQKLSPMQPILGWISEWGKKSKCRLRRPPWLYRTSGISSPYHAHLHLVVEILS